MLSGGGVGADYVALLYKLEPTTTWRLCCLQISMYNTACYFMPLIPPRRSLAFCPAAVWAPTTWPCCQSSCCPCPSTAASCRRPAPRVSRAAAGMRAAGIWTDSGA